MPGKSLLDSLLPFLRLPRFKRNAIQEYVSVTCPTGDILLSLYPNGKFELAIKKWDEALHRHTGTEQIAGRWEIDNSSLSLRGKDGVLLSYVFNPDNQIRVKDSAIKLASYDWISSSMSTFADSVSLLERHKLDEFFLKQVKPGN